MEPHGYVKQKGEDKREEPVKAQEKELFIENHHLTRRLILRGHAVKLHYWHKKVARHRK